MALPTKSKGVTTKPEELQFMFYGPPGIGKSQAAATWPDVCFLSTTRGLGHLDVPERRVESWEDFLEACSEIAEGGHGYRCFAVDLLRDLYDFCIEYITEEELGGRHPSEFDWGKGWGAVGKEFRRAWASLMNESYTVGKQKFHYGFIYIAHEDTKEVKTRSFKIDKIMPRLTKSTFEWLFGIIDILGYMEMEQYRDDDGIKERRVMHLAPSTAYEGKCWVKDMPNNLIFEDENVYDLVYQHLSKKNVTTKRKKR